MIMLRQNRLSTAAVVVFGLAAMASSSQLFTAAAGCPTGLFSDSCSICGEGSCVSNADVVVVPGLDDPTTCSSLQLVGYAGGIDADLCGILPSLIGEDCGCGTEGIQDDQLGEFDDEIPCEFGPEALSDLYGKDIPRICIDVPVGDDGSTTTAVVERCYYAYVPDSCTESAETVPLVVDIHGLGSCPLRSSTYTGWRQKAEEECFVLIWPSGEPTPGSDLLIPCFQVPGFALDVTFGRPGGNNVITGGCCCLDGNGLPVVEDGPNDPLFVKMVIDDALEKFQTKDDNNDDGVDAINDSALSLDEDRVYLAGHSNGCITALAVAAIYPTQIAKVACHAGLLATPFPPEYEDTPVPIWLVHGAEDLVILYEGSAEQIPLLGEIGYWSFPETTAYLAAKNGCAPSSSSSETVFDDDGNEIGSVVTYTDCVDDATVQAVTLTADGHSPFRTPYPPVESFGGVNTVIDTTALAWEFLSSSAEQPDDDDDDSPTTTTTGVPTMSPVTGVPTAEGAVCLKILLTNDDGYETILINDLFEYLRDHTCHDVVMVAPKEGQSGRGTSTDFFVPGLEDANPSPGIYYLASTPTTTMYFALDVVLPEIGFVPDLVVSGPNEGWNIGLGGISSGTIAAAAAAMVRGNPAIVVSASLFDAQNPLAVARITELTVKFIEDVVIVTDRNDDESSKVILKAGEGLNVNIPTVFDSNALPFPGGLAASSVDDYEFKLTKIGLASPLGGPKYFRDLADSPIAVETSGGLFNGLPGLSVEIPYFANGLYPIDDHRRSEGNAIGDVVTTLDEFAPIPTFVVTASPIEFTLETPATRAVQRAFRKLKKKPKSTKSGGGGDDP